MKMEWRLSKITWSADFLCAMVGEEWCVCRKSLVKNKRPDRSDNTWQENTGKRKAQSRNFAMKDQCKSISSREHGTDLIAGI